MTEDSFSQNRYNQILVATERARQERNTLLKGAFGSAVLGAASVLVPANPNWFSYTCAAICGLASLSYAKGAFQAHREFVRYRSNVVVVDGVEVIIPDQSGPQ